MPRSDVAAFFFGWLYGKAGLGSSRRSATPEFPHPRRQTLVSDLFRERRKPRRRTFPTQLIDLLEERRVNSQRREFFEQQRELTILRLKDFSRKLFDVAVLKI